MGGQTPAEARFDEGEEQVQRSEAGYASLGPSTAGIARPELAIEVEKTRQWCSQHRIPAASVELYIPQAAERQLTRSISFAPRSQATVKEHK